MIKLLLSIKLILSINIFFTINRSYGISCGSVPACAVARERAIREAHEAIEQQKDNYVNTYRAAFNESIGTAAGTKIRQELDSQKSTIQGERAVELDTKHPSRDNLEKEEVTKAIEQAISFAFTSPQETDQTELLEKEIEDLYSKMKEGDSTLEQQTQTINGIETNLFEIIKKQCSRTREDIYLDEDLLRMLAAFEFVGISGISSDQWMNASDDFGIKKIHQEIALKLRQSRENFKNTESEQLIKYQILCLETRL